MIGFSGTGKFLSTPSARRATGKALLTRNIAGVSIHALREEGDSPRISSRGGTSSFYPRPPRGGRRQKSASRFRCPPVSIHALREEGDRVMGMSPTRGATFLSTPSARRATISLSSKSRSLVGFLSTPSARRATVRCGLLPPGRYGFYPRPPRGGRQVDALCLSCCYVVSIHALREEGDRAPNLS